MQRQAKSFQTDLVINSEPSSVLRDQLQTLRQQVSPAVRYATLKGVDYVVVPMVMLTEGVHAGSNGPLYYPKDELAKTPAVWNHKPIVVYHPTANGSAVSACSPEVLEKRSVGMIMNTQFEPGKQGAPGRLKAEAWLEASRLGKVDQRVFNAVQAKKMMEISTGLFTDNEQSPGKWRDETYDAVARNYRPDHLAILPDEKGACSIADGAGLLRNSEMSASELQGKLGEAISSLTPVLGSPCWIEDVFDKFVIFRKGNKSYKQSYSVTKAGAVSVTGDAEEVTARRVYTTADGQTINSKGDDMDKEKLVNAIVANKAGGWDPSDRDYLMTLSEERLEALAKLSVNAEEKEKDEEDDEDEEDEEEKKKKEQGGPAQNAAQKKPTILQPAPTTNQPTKLTLNDYLGNLPAEVRETVEAAMAAQAEAKNTLIEKITANKACRFEKRWLATQPIDVLKGMALLATNNTPAAPRPLANYSGMGEVGAEIADAGEDGIEALGVPTMNFEMVGKPKAEATHN